MTATSDCAPELLAEVERLREALQRSEPSPCLAPFNKLLPYHGQGNPGGQAAALKSATQFLLGRYRNAKCDSPAVADCVCCNVVYLAHVVDQLVDAANQAAALSSQEDNHAQG